MVTRMLSGTGVGVLRALGIVGIVWGAPALATPLAAAPSGDCVTARIDAPFRLPDGVLHPAGALTLCDTRAFSPIADLHVIRVDGRTAGIFLSRKQRAEAELGRAPEVVFERDSEGHLDLVGYILPAEGRSTAFRLTSRRSAWVSDARVGVAVGPAVAVALAADTR